MHSLSTWERTLTWLVRNIPFVRRFATRVIVERFANAAPARPHPLTLADEGFTSWTGLSDRSYSARHLPPSEAGYQEGLPPKEEVLELFLRSGRTVPSKDTTLLFAFFAQWFTDSFLRMDSTDFRKNESNHGIDLIQIYGKGRTQTRMLRAGTAGLLESQTIEGEEYGPSLFEKDTSGQLRLRDRFGWKGRPGGEPSEGLYTRKNFDRVFIDGRNMTPEQMGNAIAVGLEHGNSTIGNTAMNAIYLREHNRLARLIGAAHPSWGDDRVFECARLVNIAMLLKVVIGDYISHISTIDVPLEYTVGAAERKRWARPNWMAIEFNLLYRWHGLIPDTWVLGGEERPSEKMVNNNALLFAEGTAEFFRSASRQRSGQIGLGHTPRFLAKVKRGTIDVARGARLQPYNAYRQHFGLRPMRSFSELTGDDELARGLRDLYGRVDRVEFLVGLLAERQSERDMMGRLQLTMVAHDAFTHALTNPVMSRRIWTSDTFSEVGMREIARTKRLADIIARNTEGLTASEISFRFAGA